MYSPSRTTERVTVPSFFTIINGPFEENTSAALVLMLVLLLDEDDLFLFLLTLFVFDPMEEDLYLAAMTESLYLAELVLLYEFNLISS